MQFGRSDFSLCKSCVRAKSHDLGVTKQTWRAQ
jgi:ribosomal protein S14